MYSASIRFRVAGAVAFCFVVVANALVDVLNFCAHHHSSSLQTAYFTRIRPEKCSRSWQGEFECHDNSPRTEWM